MKRIPFHFGLFFNAVVGMLGREPDSKVFQGYDGFYELRYQPKDDKEADKFREHSQTFREWLDLFEITFSDSRCEFGMPHPPQSGDKEQLQIRIVHPR